MSKPNPIPRRQFLNASAATIAALQLVSADDQINRNSPEAPLQDPSIRVQGNRFVDVDDRQVLLHGMNVISKSKTENYLSWHRAEDFAKLSEWGMNCVRLGIIWDGIEPQPGVYDDEYLSGVAERVQWAESHGISVFLDMHQDLFSVLYSDGAPRWATLHENKPHRTGEIWSDSYLISPAVHASFDNFWANAPAPDGVGIQDHYAAAWRHVAKRFANNRAVIGYDIMNEPFEGASVVASQAALLKSEFARMLVPRLGGQIESPEKVAAMWQSPEGRQTITEQLKDIDLYTAFVDAREQLSKAFERNHLQPMYQRVADAIREVDPHHALFLETSYHCNNGVYSGIEPVRGADGQRDYQQAYVPHAYDIVVDTPLLADANTGRIELIFKRHQTTAERLRMPMIIGEWGAFGTADERILASARTIQRQLEVCLCGDTYWEYHKGIEQRAYFQTLKRSIPSRISGTLLEYGSDPKTGKFFCRWKETKGAALPTTIYLTAEDLDGHTIRLEPHGEGFQLSHASSNTKDVYVTAPSTGTAIERLLVLE